MSFKVLRSIAILDNDDQAQGECKYGDEAEYDVLPGGALLIRVGDYVDMVSAGDWRYVVSDDGHLPSEYEAA